MRNIKAQRWSREIQKARLARSYQWEFLRRNPEYQCDYDKLLNRFGAWFEKKGFWYERNKAYEVPDSAFFYNRICPFLKEICRKWRISDPFTPDWTFDSHGEHEYAPGWRAYLPTGYTAEQAAAEWDYPPVRIEKHGKQSFLVRADTPMNKQPRGREARQSDVRFVWLKLDVTRPQKLLLADVLSAVRFHQRKYAHLLKRLQAAPKRRRRLDQYALYLQVWDLRERQHLSFPTIAKQIYPREYASHPKPKNPIIQRVADHYARARALVFGGYTEIA